MKPHAFLFVPGAFVGLENMVPLALRLKAEGYKITTVIVDRFMEESIRTTPGYAEILPAQGKIVKIGFHAADSKFKKIICLIQFLFLLFRMLFVVNLVVITFQPVRGIFYKFLNIFSRVRGRFYAVSKANTPLPVERFEVEERGMKDSETRKFLNKKYKTLKSTYIGKHLIHSEYETPVSDLLNLPKERFVIGYPKMMKAWRNFLAQYSVAWDNEEMAVAKSFITVILLEPHIYFFSTEDSTPRFLEEIILAIRQQFPDELIVLKPKPRPQRIKPYDYSWVGEILDRLGSKNIVLTNVPNPFLAMKSRAAIIVGETTALFEYWIAGVPCFEHSRYSTSWLKLYPFGSFWFEFGVLHTTTPEELEEQLVKIKNSTFPIASWDMVAQMFGHREDTKVFEKI